MDFYPSNSVRSVLDCTINKGRFWAGSKYKSLVTGMDIDPSHLPDIVGDNRTMDGVADNSFDVVVYDPPHIPNQGKDRTKDFRDRFGLGGKSGKDDNYNFAHEYVLVLKQIARVLKDGGVFFAKITDYVHNHRYQWALVDFVLAVRGAGMTPCDLVIKTRKGPIIDPKWKNRHHVRRRHCYWVVGRNSLSCEK